MTGSLGLEMFTRGQYVEVFGLQSQTGRLLNRLKGMIIKANADTGRFDVCLNTGAEGKMASLKPECLKLVPGASAEEVQDAKDVAGPALRAAQKDDNPAAESVVQPEEDVSCSTRIPSPERRERSRSWSPPPEAVRAASLAGQQASSAAVARGLSTDQAEAIGAEAAQDLLKRKQEEANLQKQNGNHNGSTDNAPQKSSDMAAGGAAPIQKRLCKSLEDVQVGDKVQAFGLKGKDEELNGETFTIKDFRGWGGPRKRKYVVSTIRLVINAQGDPAEEKKVMTLPAKNVRLPGDQGDYEDSNGSSDSSKASKRSRKKSRPKRSRSRRRRRRSSSSSSSSSHGKPPPTTRPRGQPAPAMTKAQRLAKFNFIPQGQRR